MCCSFFAALLPATARAERYGAFINGGEHVVHTRRAPVVLHRARAAVQGRARISGAAVSAMFAKPILALAATRVVVAYETVANVVHDDAEPFDRSDAEQIAVAWLAKDNLIDCLKTFSAKNRVAHIPLNDLGRCRRKRVLPNGFDSRRRKNIPRQPR